MHFSFTDVAVTGQIVVLPRRDVAFLDEMHRFAFPPARSIALKNAMGYDRHRIVHDGVCVSDLAIEGFRHLFSEGLVAPGDIDALVVVTQTPDHLIPPTSYLIQGALGLRSDLYCLDINQGCAGYLIGLIQAFQLLGQSGIRRVALVNADVLSRKISSQDRNSYPLVGDAAAISIIERREGAGSVCAIVRTDGGRHGALIVPAGGIRIPSSSSTCVPVDAGDGNWRAPDHLVMDGSAVFNFVMADVPPLIDETLAFAGVTKASIDYFLCHQPNRFMLNKLAEKLGVANEKVPSNVVEKYGNSSGATIPVCIALNFSEDALKQSYQVCLAGFGVGLTWAAMTMNLGPMRFCRTLEVGEP